MGGETFREKLHLFQCHLTNPTSAGSWRSLIVEVIKYTKMKTYTAYLTLLLTLANTAFSQETNPPQSYEKYLLLRDKAFGDRSAKGGADETKEEVVEEEGVDKLVELKKVSSRKTQQLSQLVMMDNTIGVVFPGAFLWAAAARDGQLHQLDQIPGRPPVTITFSGLVDPTTTAASASTNDLVVMSGKPRNSSKPFSSFSTNGTFSDFEEKSRKIFKSSIPATNRIVADYNVSSSLKEALLNTGLSANYWCARMSAGLGNIEKSDRTVAILTLDQVYYSAATDAPLLGGYLPDELVKNDPLLAARLAQGAITGGEVSYVRKVDYGRRLIATMSSQSSVDEFKQALSFAVKAIGSGIEGTESAEVKKAWNSVEGKLILIGGNYPDGLSEVFGGDMKSFVNAVKSVMSKESLAYNPKAGAVPIAFELGYARDNAPMQVFETAEFAGRIPLRVFGKVTQKKEVRTSGADSAIVQGDSEIDSDDWTLVRITSQKLTLSQDKRTLHFDIEWSAYEGESDRTIDSDNTIITSSKRFDFSFNKPIKSIISPTAFGSAGQWYAGGIDTPQAFPDHGLLNNIRVNFDGDGDNDNKRQSLTADLTFTIWLEE